MTMIEKIINGNGDISDVKILNAIRRVFRHYSTMFSQTLNVSMTPNIDFTGKQIDEHITIFRVVQQLEKLI